MGSRRSLTAKLPSSNSKLCGVSDCSTRPPRVCAIVFMCRVCRSSPSVHLHELQNLLCQSSAAGASKSSVHLYLFLYTS